VSEGQVRTGFLALNLGAAQRKQAPFLGGPLGLVLVNLSRSPWETCLEVPGNNPF